jgi:hypothetical protein
VKLDPSCIGDLSRSWLSCLVPLFYCSQLWIIWLSKISIVSVPDECYSRNASIVSVPDECYSKNASIVSVPDECYSRNASIVSVPDDCYSRNASIVSVPDECYSRNASIVSVPNECYSRNASIVSVPDEYYSRNVSIVSVPDECYSRNASCALNLISTFLFVLLIPCGSLCDIFCNKKKIKIGPYVFRSIIIRWKWKQLVLSYILHFFKLHLTKGPSWSCSYDSWIYNYLCNQYLVLLALWVRVSLMGRCTRYNIMW